MSNWILLDDRGRDQEWALLHFDIVNLKKKIKNKLS